MTEDLRARLEEMPTEELVEILAHRDPEQWRPEVFPLVESILLGRGVDPAGIAPAASEPPADDGDSLVGVGSFGSTMEASLCKMALQEAGIDAWLSTEHLSGIAPPLVPVVGLEVLVRSGQAPAAREILAAIQSGAAAIPADSEDSSRDES